MRIRTVNGSDREVVSVGAIEDRVFKLAHAKYGNNLAEFARSIGVNYQTLHSLENGGSFGTAQFKTVLPIARALDIDPYSLLTGKLVFRDRLKETVEVPLFGSITAGMPADPAPSNETYPIPAELHERYPDAFLLRVAGKSMNLVIPDGSYALIDPCTTADDPSAPYAVTVGENAATLKFVRPLENGLELVPASSDVTIHPVVLDRADPDAPRVSLIGRVVWHTAPTDWEETR